MEKSDVTIKWSIVIVCDIQFYYFILNSLVEEEKENS